MERRQKEINLKNAAKKLKSILMISGTSTTSTPITEIEAQFYYGYVKEKTKKSSIIPDDNIEPFKKYTSYAIIQAEKMVDLVLNNKKNTDFQKFSECDPNYQVIFVFDEKSKRIAEAMIDFYEECAKNSNNNFQEKITALKNNVSGYEQSVENEKIKQQSLETISDAAKKLLKALIVLDSGQDELDLSTKPDYYLLDLFAATRMQSIDTDKLEKYTENALKIAHEIADKFSNKTLIEQNETRVAELENYLDPIKKVVIVFNWKTKAIAEAMLSFYKSCNKPADTRLDEAIKGLEENLAIYENSNDPKKADENHLDLLNEYINQTNQDLEKIIQNYLIERKTIVEATNLTLEEKQAEIDKISNKTIDALNQFYNKFIDNRKPFLRNYYRDKTCASGEVLQKTSPISFEGLPEKQSEYLNDKIDSFLSKSMAASETTVFVKPASPEAHDKTSSNDGIKKAALLLLGDHYKNKLIVLGKKLIEQKDLTYGEVRLFNEKKAIKDIEKAYLDEKEIIDNDQSLISSVKSEKIKALLDVKISKLSELRSKLLEINEYIDSNFPNKKLKDINLVGRFLGSSLAEQTAINTPETDLFKEFSQIADDCEILHDRAVIEGKKETTNYSILKEIDAEAEKISEKIDLIYEKAIEKLEDLKKSIDSHSRDNLVDLMELNQGLINQLSITIKFIEAVKKIHPDKQTPDLEDYKEIIKLNAKDLNTELGDLYQHMFGGYTLIDLSKVDSRNTEPLPKNCFLFNSKIPAIYFSSEEKDHPILLGYLDKAGVRLIGKQLAGKPSVDLRIDEVNQVIFKNIKHKIYQQEVVAISRSKRDGYALGYTNHKIYYYENGKRIKELTGLYIQENKFGSDGLLVNHNNLSNQIPSPASLSIRGVMGKYLDAQNNYFNNCWDFFFSKTKINENEYINKFEKALSEYNKNPGKRENYMALKTILTEGLVNASTLSRNPTNFKSTLSDFRKDLTKIKNGSHEGEVSDVISELLTKIDDVRRGMINDNFYSRIIFGLNSKEKSDIENMKAIEKAALNYEISLSDTDRDTLIYTLRKMPNINQDFDKESFIVQLNNLHNPEASERFQNKY